MAITLTNLLKQDSTFSSNIFQGPFNADFAAANASLVVIIIISSSSNSSSSGGDEASDSDSNSISSCGSSKILTWTGKYKSGVMTGARVGQYKFGLGLVNTNLEPGSVNINWGPEPININLGPGLGPANANTRYLNLLVLMNVLLFFTFYLQFIMR